MSEVCSILSEVDLYAHEFDSIMFAHEMQNWGEPWPKPMVLTKHEELTSTSYDARALQVRTNKRYVYTFEEDEQGVEDWNAHQHQINAILQQLFEFLLTQEPDCYVYIDPCYSTGPDPFPLRYKEVGLSDAVAAMHGTHVLMRIVPDVYI